MLVSIAADASGFIVVAFLLFCVNTLSLLGVKLSALAVCLFWEGFEISSQRLFDTGRNLLLRQW